jgi:ATP-dependent HslUV protease ATP-binding subunit HslU
LIRQYQALMKTEGIELLFEDEAIRAMSQIAAEVNENTENIGARRLHTVLERVLEELSFTAPELAEQQFVVTADYVQRQLSEISRDEDLSRFIL